MKFECIGVNGFAGDRTSEGMRECHEFTRSFADHFGFPYELVGAPEAARDLPWDSALLESKATFENAVKHLRRILEAQRKPILVTPRCATSIASLPVILAEYPHAMILYFDAHGDLNTPAASTSGYLGGMPITAALGEWESGYGAGLEVANLVHIGGRDIDAAEHAFIEKHNILTISKQEIETNLDNLSKTIKGKPVFIHIDTDVYDPSEVTAEYAVDNGLFKHHVKRVVDMVLAEAKLVGLEITELSPRNESERRQSYDALFDSFSGLG